MALKNVSEHLADSPSKAPAAQRLQEGYEALQKVLDSGSLGQHSFYLSKPHIESIMGLLSGEFEGVW